MTVSTTITAQKMKFSIKDFFSKYDSDLVTFTEKSLMKNFIFCAVYNYENVIQSAWCNKKKIKAT